MGVFLLYTVGFWRICSNANEFLTTHITLHNRHSKEYLTTTDRRGRKGLFTHCVDCHRIEAIGDGTKDMRLPCFTGRKNQLTH